MISLEGVTKQYLYGARVLGTLDFTVSDGEIVSVLGGEGSGKTTLLKVIAGVTDCEGRVLVDGEPIAKRPENVQFVFDDLAVFKNRTCFYNLAYPLNVRGIDKEKIREAVEGAARELGISACLPEKVKKLPLIDVKRLAVARLLLRDAKNILIDDITSGLSAGEARELWAGLVLILLKKAAQGATVIYSTSSVEEALSIADRIAVMSGGELKQLDTPKSIYEQPSSVWAAQALDKNFHFESATLSKDGDSLTLTGNELSLDVSQLKDRVPASYIGVPILAGWHGVDFAEDGVRREDVAYVVREGDGYVHHTVSDVRVVLGRKRDRVCTSPRPERIMFFDAKSENSILI